MAGSDNRRRLTTFAIGVGLWGWSLTALVGCAGPAPGVGPAARPAAAAPAGALEHIVIVWLKQPGDPEARRRLRAATLSFVDLPGLLAVEVGTPQESRRPAVDDSFDLGIRMRFRDPASLEHYLNHPRHRQLVETVLVPLVDRFVVYDVLLPGQ